MCLSAPWAKKKKKKDALGLGRGLTPAAQGFLGVTE